MVIARKNDGVGLGNKSTVYKVRPTIVVKTINGKSSKAEEHLFLREIQFYKCLNNQQDR